MIQHLSILKKRSFFFESYFLILLITTFPSNAQDIIANNPEKPIPKESPLPPIDADLYEVKVLDHSHSHQIYLLETIGNHSVKTGKIILLKKDTNPVMGLRVLRTYPEKKTFAVKQVKPYPSYSQLDSGQTFSALEKIADKPFLTITPEEAKALQILEEKKNLTSPKILPYDPELDLTTLPEPEVFKKDPHPSQEGIDLQSSVEIEPQNDEMTSETDIAEIRGLDPYLHWISLGLGFLKNRNDSTTSNTSFYSAGWARYGFTFKKLTFLKQVRLQDSFTLEGGGFFYKTINFATLGDAYHIMGLTTYLRYNILLHESLIIFFYGGILKNYVTSAHNGQASTSNALNSFIPGFGGGFLFQLGPGWYTRVDIGYESVCCGLVLHV